MRPQHLLIRFVTTALLLILLPIPHTVRLSAHAEALHPTPIGLAQTTQDRKAEGDRLLQQGIQQYQISQFKAAFRSWQQALKIYREIKDRQGEGWALGELGLAYQSLDNDAKAIEYEQQHLAIARETHDRQSEGKALGNLGIVYKHLG